VFNAVRENEKKSTITSGKKMIMNCRKMVTFHFHCITSSFHYIFIKCYYSSQGRSLVVKWFGSGFRRRGQGLNPRGQTLKQNVCNGFIPCGMRFSQEFLRGFLAKLIASESS
jgi:hypothetical protein